MSSLWILAVFLSLIVINQESDAFYLLTINSPFQLQIPVITPTFSVNCAWISVTSVAFPGLFAAYLYRFDYSRATHIYIIASSIAYFFGAVLWNIISSFSRRAIPFDSITQFFMILAIVFMAFNRK